MRVREIVALIEEDDSGDETIWNYLVLQAFDEDDDEHLAKGTANSEADANRNVLDALKGILPE